MLSLLEAIHCVFPNNAYHLTLLPNTGSTVKASTNLMVLLFTIIVQSYRVLFNLPS